MGTTEAAGAPADVRGFLTAWVETANAGSWGPFAELLHPDVVVHDPMSPVPARGRAAALTRTQQQYQPFPDGRIDVLGEPFVSLDPAELAYRWRFTGTHAKAIDPPGFAPTGRRVAIDGVSVLRFSDQLVIEARLFFDSTDVARQVLAAPPVGSPLERVVVLSQRLRARLRRPRGR